MDFGCLELYFFFSMNLLIMIFIFFSLKNYFFFFLFPLNFRSSAKYNNQTNKLIAHANNDRFSIQKLKIKYQTIINGALNVTLVYIFLGFIHFSQHNFKFDHFNYFTFNFGSYDSKK